MYDLMQRVHIKLQALIADDSGQDLVEYSLCVALVAFGSIMSMESLSSEINSAFITISSDLATSL
jgi:Flp pilus assembly pilin Flp